MKDLTGLRNSLTTADWMKDPFSSMQREFDQIVNKFQNVFKQSPTTVTSEKFIINPSIDIINDKDRFKVEFEMPGVGENDIKVSINDGVLSIKAEKHLSRKNKNVNYVSREICYGSYERNIQLPDSVNVDKAEASFKKGMLWIDIPKKSESKKQNKELTIKKITE
jgi:HSP20 family protein